MIRSKLAGLILSGTLVLAGPVGAQSEGVAHRPLPPADSARINRAARSEQADFERLRRNRLPETWPRGGGPCHERIGRFCLTHDDDGEDWVAPPEHPDLVTGRLALVDRLAEAARLLPGDGWVAGQRVRYLVEGRRFAEAARAASECRAEADWCAALAGFALHYAGLPAQADSAFTVALARMDATERARWTDLGAILDGAGRRAYERLDAAGRTRFEERFWRLADPLLTRPGNELRSEHLARHVMDQLQVRAQAPDGVNWGSDLREILIRYGWPAGWERTRGRGFQTLEASYISHYSSSPQNLLPPAPTVLGDTTEAGAWDLEHERSRSGHDLPLADSVARWFYPLAHQMAAFRRGPNALLAAVYELPADSMPREASTSSGLALLPTLDPLEPPTIALHEGVGPRGQLLASAPARPLLASLEIVVPDERRMARARREINLAPLAPGEMAISDILLIEAALPLPDSLPGALDRALSSARFQAGKEIGIYWELYGVTPERTPGVYMSLRLLEERSSWLGRLARRAGLLREVAPIRLRWQEAATPGDFSARSLSIRVPDVSPGSYVLELSAEVEGFAPLTARREIEVVAAGDP